MAKDARLQELELKVQRLETQLMEQEKELHQTPLNSRIRSVYSKVREGSDVLWKHAAQGKTFFRTCREIYRSDQSLNSGMYWIDPDGYGNENPIHVHCDMELAGRYTVLPYLIY